MTEKEKENQKRKKERNHSFGTITSNVLKNHVLILELI